MNNPAFQPDLPVIVTGGTGFVGQYVVRELLDSGHRVRVLTRSSRLPNARYPEVETVHMDIHGQEDLSDAFRGCGAVIHLVGIIEEHPSSGITFESVHREGTRRVVEASRAAGIRTFLHMSANGASPDGVSRYQTTKWESEDMVRGAGFDHWTIFRPSLIFGKPGDGCPEFCTQLIDKLIRPLPIWPIIGNGRYRMQPVAVEDVASAFIRALETDGHNRKSYCLAGPESVSYIEILDTLADAAGLRRRPKLFQPTFLTRPVIRLLSPLGILPITIDQLDMLLAGNTCGNADLERDFGITPIPFEPGSLGYLSKKS